MQTPTKKRKCRRTPWPEISPSPAKALGLLMIFATSKVCAPLSIQSLVSASQTTFSKDPSTGATFSVAPVACDLRRSFAKAQEHFDGAWGWSEAGKPQNHE